MMHCYRWEYPVLYKAGKISSSLTNYNIYAALMLMQQYPELYM